MDTIRDQIKNPLIIGLSSFVVGLLIGWFLFGWVIWPVQWTDATPDKLAAVFQEDYLRMAIDSNAARPDPLIAKQRYDNLGDKGPAVLQSIQANPLTQDPQAIANFATAVSAPSAGLPVISTPGEETPAVLTPGATTPPVISTAPTTRSWLPILLFLMCGLTILLGVVFGALYYLRNRGGVTTRTPIMEAQEAARQAPMTDYVAMGEQTPIAQFMASYKIGDDLFDDSFSIDSPSGEFLGECGVGISETIGVGDPKKVTSFEVWLFDKNDIQTVTKVLMSAHAFEDSAIRQRLAAKGEPFLAEPGVQTILETATLRLVARIVDMSYGEGALPDRSFFDSLILEMAVWQI